MNLRAAVFFVLAAIAGCASHGTMHGTQSHSMWERSAPGAPGPVSPAPLSD